MARGKEGERRGRKGEREKEREMRGGARDLGKGKLVGWEVRRHKG